MYAIVRGPVADDTGYRHMMLVLQRKLRVLASSHGAVISGGSRRCATLLFSSGRARETRVNSARDVILNSARMFALRSE